MTRRGILAVISGFSGAGKGTLVNLLMQKYEQYALSISATTRSPRPGEKEGVHYFFKSKEEFEQMVERDELLEHACYVGNYYGTPRAFVEKQLEEGKDVILEIEVQGALQVKRQFPEALLLFVTTPDADELLRRLHKRGSETEEQIRGRLQRAAQEAELIRNYDSLIIAYDPESGVEQIHCAVEAARMRPDHNEEFISTIGAELKERGEQL